LSYAANKQTDRQTNSGENGTSPKEVEVIVDLMVGHGTLLAISGYHCESSTKSHLHDFR